VGVYKYGDLVLPGVVTSPSKTSHVWNYEEEEAMAQYWAVAPYTNSYAFSRFIEWIDFYKLQ